MELSKLLILSAGLFSVGTEAYWRQLCSTIQTGRIDPIISPGEISSHVHKLAGGSNVGLNSTYASLRNSACTSCEVQADKSAYWTPQLYYQSGTDGTFQEVPNSGMTVYYLGRGENAANIVPFPPGFRMLSGNMFARSFDNTTMTWTNNTQLYPDRPVADRVTFHCLDSSGTLPQLNYMWRTNCSNGLRAQIKFQSCWDGKNPYLENNGHVAYMSSIDNGICPPTHPVQLVSLFFEVLYGVNNMNQSDGGRFVFSYGDPTGYGFHGDFYNGWDMTVLENALTDCANVDNGGVVSACAPLAAVDDVLTYYLNCPESAPNAYSLVNETVHGKIGAALPGCINIVDGPVSANISDVTCASNVAKPVVQSFAPQTPVQYVYPTVGQMFGNNGWQYVSCFEDYYENTRTMDTITKQNSSLTVESCQTWCTGLGYRYAGLEYGEHCFCGASFNSSVPSNSTGCTQVCAGNSSEFCGGPDRLAIFNNTLFKSSTTSSTKSASSTTFMASPTATPTTSASAGIYVGCATDPNISGRALNMSSYTSSGNMTLENCRAFCDAGGYLLSGTEYSTQCFCGNKLVNNGTLLPTSTNCNMPCSGSSSETCGGPVRLSLYNSTVVKALPSAVARAGNYTYRGCWIDSSSSRALTALSHSNSTSMTVENCVSYCAAAGYKYAGIEYGEQCYCGNALASGRLAATSDCNMVCSGNRYEYCGAGWRLSLYSKSK